MAASNFDPESAPFMGALKFARKEPVSFCFMLDKSGSAPAMELHRVKAGKALFNNAKKADPKLAKGTFGTATLDGKILTLQCEKNVSGLPKACKAWVKNAKHAMIKKIVPMLDGQIIEDDADQDAQEKPVEAPGTPQPAPSDANAKKVKEALIAAIQGCKGVVAAPTLQAAAQKAQAALAANDLKTAVAVIAALKKQAAKAPGTGAPQASKPAFAQLAKDWQKLRNEGLKQTKAISKLMLLEHPDATDQAQKLAALYSAFNRKLGPCLHQLSTDIDDAKRAKLITLTRATVAEYRKVLKTDPMFAHMADNPYIQMDPIGDMVPALDAIEKALG